MDIPGVESRLDPRDLDSVSVEDALGDLKTGHEFHTRDLIETAAFKQGHRRLLHTHDLEAIGVVVEAWLQRHGVAQGLRGPLPGHPALGARWAWR